MLSFPLQTLTAGDVRLAEKSCCWYLFAAPSGSRQGARETQEWRHPQVLMPVFQHHSKPAHEGRNSLSTQTTSSSLTSFSISPDSSNDLSQRCNLYLQIQHHFTPTWRANIYRKTGTHHRWAQPVAEEQGQHPGEGRFASSTETQKAPAPTLHQHHHHGLPLHHLLPSRTSL